MEWAVIGLGLLLFGGWLLYGLVNKPAVKLEEEYTEYAETMEAMRKADLELNDPAYRQRLLDEDNQN